MENETLDKYLAVSEFETITEVQGKPYIHGTRAASQLGSEVRFLFLTKDTR